MALNGVGFASRLIRHRNPKPAILIGLADEEGDARITLSRDN